MPGDKADVHATKLPFTYRISKLSFPLQGCHSRYNCVVIFLKGLLFCIRERQLWSGGNESVEIRYVNGSFVAKTSATLPGVSRHTVTHAFYILPYCLKQLSGQHCTKNGIHIYTFNCTMYTYTPKSFLNTVPRP